MRVTRPCARRGGIGRRPLLKMLGGGAAYALCRPGFAWSSTDGYRVGVAAGLDAYRGTLRAIDACGEWPAVRISGGCVVIKPNLVSRDGCQAGATTDPEVVRALIDLAIDSGAAEVWIIEGGPFGAHFFANGYWGLRAKYRQGGVRLVDLCKEAQVLATVPGGLAYRNIYLPALLFDSDVVFISAAKLKVHTEVGATIATKNLFGLPPVESYFLPGQPAFRPRFHLHDRGAHQTIVDLNLARPIDFAVVDGIWGMEGLGPTRGTPVRMDLVFAGRNALAVDRACADAMQLDVRALMYFTYAAEAGIGPASLDEVTLAGDAYSRRSFENPVLAPPLWRPTASPTRIRPAEGAETLIRCRLDTDALVRASAILTSDTVASFTHVRVLQRWQPSTAGEITFVWDGRDDRGEVVAPGEYTVHVEARYPGMPLFSTHASTKVTVR